MQEQKQIRAFSKEDFEKLPEVIRARSCIEPDKFAELVVQLKKIPHGRVTIFMQDGKPVRIEEGIKSIKL